MIALEKKNNGTLYQNDCSLLEQNTKMLWGNT